MMVFSCSALHAAVNFSQVDPVQPSEPFTQTNPEVLFLRYVFTLLSWTSVSGCQIAPQP